MHHARAFGLTWQSDFALEYFTPVANVGPADVAVRQVAQLADRAILKTINRGAVCADGFRFTWDDQAKFDVYAPVDGVSRIEVQPLPGWTGALPWAFYSTVTALLLAGRGRVPFHACAVAIDGQAVLLCGGTGAGKSTLTAGLVQGGATFLADDLSVVEAQADQLLLHPGRPGVRLFAPVAELIAASPTQPVAGDPRGKVIAALAARQSTAAIPLSAIALIGDAPFPVPLALRFAALARHLFRPKWLAQLPGHAAREAVLRTMVTDLPLLSLPPLGQVDPASFDARCTAALATIKAAL